MTSADGPQLLATPATAAAILEALTAAGLDADLDDEGDVRIVDYRVGPLYLLVGEGILRFLAGFSFQPRSSRHGAPRAREPDQRQPAAGARDGR